MNFGPIYSYPLFNSSQAVPPSHHDPLPISSLFLKRNSESDSCCIYLYECTTICWRTGKQPWTTALKKTNYPYPSIRQLSITSKLEWGAHELLAHPQQKFDCHDLVGSICREPQLPWIQETSLLWTKTFFSMSSPSTPTALVLTSFPPIVPWCALKFLLLVIMPVVDL